MWESINGRCWGIGPGFVAVYRPGGERGLRGYRGRLGRRVGFVRGCASVRILRHSMVRRIVGSGMWARRDVRAEAFEVQEDRCLLGTV